MRLNFWQILGIVLLIIAIVLVTRERIAPQSAPPPATASSAPAQ